MVFGCIYAGSNYPHFIVSSLLVVCNSQMVAPGYADKVPEGVQEANTKKLGEYEAQKESVLKAMRQFESLK